MFTSISNPFLDQQEHPLDLSVKNKDIPAQKQNVENVQTSFDFANFYLTYYKIASRSSPTYLSHDNRGLAQNSLTNYTEVRMERKRKLSGSSCEAEEEVEEFKKDYEKDINKTIGQRIMKKKAKIQVSGIKDTCDCRFCYEDHIIKMRLKTERPWLKC